METVLRLFVSSPGDVPGERRRIDLVVERLNTEFAGRVRIETVRWELSYYSAHETFQRQIPEAAECDVVVAVFRGRLGTPLPAGFPPLPSGEPYPSGTAYEVLSAMEVRRAGKRVPDVYVFRYPDAPSVGLDAPDRAEIETQWERLKRFFDTWFRNQSGEFLAAFQTYSSTDDFAVKVEDCLRQWLAQRGFLAQGAVWDRVLHGSPFPGLSAFDADRGRVFFGRDMACGQAIQRLHEAEQAGRLPFLLLIGASGSGKSSLLRAGLLPRLVLPGAIPDVDAWRVAVMTPGADPFAALAAALFAEDAIAAELRAATFRTPELLARQLAGDPEIALAPVREAMARVAARRQQDAGYDAPRPARLALGIDQAERLFTEAAPDAAARLAGLLSALVHQRIATVVMVLRSDAYPAFQGVEALVALREAGATLDLVAPSAAELEEIVTRPVALCQPPLGFAQRGGRSLAALLVADARGGDALPLLQVSLARLYAAEAGRGDGVLRFADYAGMDAAVTQTANDALATLDAASRAELPALVAGLVSDVSADPRTGAAVPVVAALDRRRFETGPARAALVEAFVAKRLLTAEGGGARPLVRPVHEALLRIWPQAVAIVAQTGSLIRVRHTLAPLVRAWEAAEASAKATHLDLSPALLDGAQALVARFGADLPDAMEAFVAAAAVADAARRDRERQDQERRIRDAEALAAARRRTARRTMAGLALAVVLAVLAGWQWQQAQAQRDRAKRSLTIATQTANSLVFALAQKFQNTVGVPVAVVKDILDRARQLQDQLLAAGETTPALRTSQAAALIKSSNALATLGDTASALATVNKACGVLDRLHTEQPAAVAYDALLATCRDETGTVQMQRGDVSAALASYQAGHAAYERLAAANPADAALKGNLLVAGRNIGLAQQRQGALDAALGSFQAALGIAQSLTQSSSVPLAASGVASGGPSRMVHVLHDDVGDVQLAQGDLPAALASFRAARDARAAGAGADAADAELQHDLLVSDERIGTVQMRQGDLPGALASYQAMLAIASRLAASDGGNTFFRDTLAIAQADVGSVLLQQGALPAALASYQAALANREALARQDPANTEWQHAMQINQWSVGDVQSAMGDKAAAEASYRAALDILRRLGTSDPANMETQHDLWVVHEKIGDVQAARDHAQDAADSFRRSMAIATVLTAAQPGNADWQRDLAALDNRIGDVLRVQGRVAEASASYRAGLAVMDGLLRRDPANPGWLHDHAVGNLKFGDAVLAQDDAAGALASYRSALASLDRLVALAPGNVAWQHDRSVCQERIGDVQAAQADRTAALTSYQDALAIRKRLADKDPGNARWQRELSGVHAKIAEMQQGGSQLGGGQSAAALSSLGAAIQILDRLTTADPTDTALRRTLSVLDNRAGDLRKAAGDLAGALASYQAALAIGEALAGKDPSEALWQQDLAFTNERVAGVAIAQGNLPAALARFGAARDARARLAAAQPENAALQRQLAATLDLVGGVQTQTNDPAAALASYQAEAAIRGRLAEAEPGSIPAQRDQAQVLSKLDATQFALHDVPAALASARAAAAAYARIAAAAPDDAAWQRALSVAGNRVGDLALESGDGTGAAAQYAAALAIVDRLSRADPGNAGLQRDLAVTNGRIASTLARQGMREAALAKLHQARDIMELLRQRSPGEPSLSASIGYFDRRIAELEDAP